MVTRVIEAKTYSFHVEKLLRRSELNGVAVWYDLKNRNLVAAVLLLGLFAVPNFNARSFRDAELLGVWTVTIPDSFGRICFKSLFLSKCQPLHTNCLSDVPT